MDVWFCRVQEPMPESVLCALNILGIDDFHALAGLSLTRKQSRRPTIRTCVSLTEKGFSKTKVVRVF
jgi:hypothetical protein